MVVQKVEPYERVKMSQDSWKVALKRVVQQAYGCEDSQVLAQCSLSTTVMEFS